MRARSALLEGPGRARRPLGRYKAEFGDNFIGVDIDSSPGNPNGIKKTAHSVLTEELVDQPGHPTKDALDRVLAFFRDRLTP